MTGALPGRITGRRVSQYGRGCDFVTVSKLMRNNNVQR
jgi:hypothetical protein